MYMYDQMRVTVSAEQQRAKLEGQSWISRGGLGRDGGGVAARATTLAGQLGRAQAVRHAARVPARQIIVFISLQTDH